MKYFKYFLAALMFYTRIPIRKIKGYDSSMFNGSSQFLPTIGLIVGGLTAGMFYVFSLFLPLALAIMLSMAFSAFLTGAFHEDGLADFCDGFGGGYTKDKILSIMKDSTIGTYGAIGLGFVLAIKLIALNSLNPITLIGIMVAAHTLSRVVPIVLIHTSTYARTDSSGKVTTAIENRSGWALTFALCTGLIPMAWINLNIFLIFIAIMLPFLLVFRYYIHKKIGGYTGDVLGAMQQFAELCFYLCAVVINNNPTWSFI